MVLYLPKHKSRPMAKGATSGLIIPRSWVRSPPSPRFSEVWRRLGRAVEDRPAGTALRDGLDQADNFVALVTELAGELHELVTLLCRAPRSGGRKR